MKNSEYSLLHSLINGFHIKWNCGLNPLWPMMTKPYEALSLQNDIIMTRSGQVIHVNLQLHDHDHFTSHKFIVWNGNLNHVTRWIPALGSMANRNKKSRIVWESIKHFAIQYYCLLVFIHHLLPHPSPHCHWQTVWFLNDWIQVSGNIVWWLVNC